MTTARPIDRPLSARDPRLGPWRAFLQAHARVARRLDDELRAEHDLSVAEYDALLNIAEAPGRRIRMRQLSDRLVLSKSGVTRLIDRLVDDGLVERSACLSDARGAEAVLTDAGLRRLRAASRTHLRGIEDHFLDALDPRQLEAVGDAMRAIADRAGTGPSDPGLDAPGGTEATPLPEA
jgi:DNA-binding MarR family transcriptional regulator